MSVKEQIESIEGIAPELIEKILPIVQAEKDESFNAGTGRAYEELEKIGKDLFGVDKEENEKATSYLIRGNELAQKRIKNQLEETYQKVAIENERLKGEIKKGIPDDKFKQDYESLKETHQNVLSEFDKFKQDTELWKGDFQTESKIKNGLSRLNLKSDSPEYLNFKIDKFITDVKGRFEVVEKDGGIFFKGGESEGHKDYTLEQLAEKEMSDLLKKETPGIKGDDGKVIEGQNVKISNSKSKAEALHIIREEVISEGTPLTSRDYSAKYKEKQEKYKAELAKLK